MKQPYLSKQAKYDMIMEKLLRLREKHLKRATKIETLERKAEKLADYLKKDNTNEPTA